MIVRAMSIVLFLAGLLLAFGGYMNASKPSTSPVIVVVGSFIVPALLFWWAWICHKKASKPDK